MVRSGNTNKKPPAPGLTLADRHVQALVELEHYKILVESVEDYAIFLLDTEGYILTWNKGAQKNKGYTAEEIIGQHFSKFYQEEDVISDKPGRELALAIQRGRVEDEDWRVRKDGSKFWANVIITTLYDQKGRHIGFAKVTRDLTERKRQEDAVRRSNVDLLDQQRELELLNNSKDEFISLASHQLRTPATAIKQLLGFLTEGLYGDLPPQIAKILEKAYESNERQLSIVNSLLNVAQVDAGKVILNRASVDAVQLLRDILEDYQDIFLSRKQIGSLELVAEQPILVKVDSEYMRMAIENLIDNASKYTPDGGQITVTISQDGESVFIHIADTGVGISKDEIKKLFNKFSRIPNEMSQKVGGSGLGLYWLKKVIELHGGKIEINSKVGEGATFTVVLPKLAE